MRPRPSTNITPILFTSVRPFLVVFSQRCRRIPLGILDPARHPRGNLATVAGDCCRNSTMSSASSAKPVLHHASTTKPPDSNLFSHRFFAHREATLPSEGRGRLSVRQHWSNKNVFNVFTVGGFTRSPGRRREGGREGSWTDGTGDETEQTADGDSSLAAQTTIVGRDAVRKSGGVRPPANVKIFSRFRGYAC